MRLSILGDVTLVSDAGPHPLGHAGKRVVGLLALHHPASVRVDDAAEALYPSETPERARRALHSTVWRLRRQLPAGAIVTTGGAYSLGRAVRDLDVTELDRLASEGRAALLAGRLDEAVDACHTVIERARAPLSASCEDLPGAAARAARTADLNDAAVEDWAEAMSRLGRASHTVEPLRRLTAERPLRERAWSLLVDALRGLERWAEIADVADLACRQLADVGIEPGAELAGALDRAAGRPGPRARVARAAVPPWLRLAAAQGTFVGRASERDSVLAAVDLAEDRRSQLVLVSGEPGIGKTRLVAEVARVAAGRGLHVWGGRCDEHQAVPYGSLFETIRRLVGAIEPADAARLQGGPLGGLLSTTTGTSARADAGGALFGLFDAVAELFTLATADSAAVLVVDDLQWASNGTLLLLRHLLRSAPQLRLCVLATVRSTATGDPSGTALRTELGRLDCARAVSLDGLTARDIAAHPELDATGEDRLVAAERLRARTGGNPLLVTTVLTTQEAGDLQRVAPGAVDAVIEAHLAVLDGTARRVLALAAASGQEFEPGLLRAAAPRPPVGADAATVNSALDAAEAAGIVLVAPDSARYQFRHELLRDAVLGSLRTTERASLHLALADAIEERGNAGAAPGLYHLAMHLHEAGAVVDDDRALSVARRAADLATRNIDFATAARYYDMAAAAAARAGSNDHADLLVSAAASWRCAGSPQTAADRLDVAIATARDNAWTLALARAAAARGELDLELEGRLTGDVVGQVDLAHDRLADADPALAAQLRFLRCIGGGSPGRLADRLAVASDDPAALEVLQRAFWVAPVADRPALARRLAASADALGTPRLRALALLTDWIVRIEQGEGTVDDPVAAEIDALVEEAPGDADLRWLVGAWTAGRHIAAGRFGAAAASVEQAYRQAIAAELPTGRKAQVFAVHRGQLGVIAMFIGPLGGLHSTTASVDRLWTADPIGWDRTAAAALVLAGRLDEARPRFERTCDQLLEEDRVRPAFVASLALTGVVAAALDDRPRIKELLIAGEPYRGMQCVFRNSHLLGSFDQSVGRLHRQLGEFDAAVDAFTAGRALDRRQGVLPFAAVAGMELVRTLVLRSEPGDHATADRVAGEVRTECDELGLLKVAHELDLALGG